MVFYDVRCTFTDPDVARRWVAWLREEHLQEVLDAGAATAAVARVRGEGWVYEARYTFASAEAFAVYEAEEAPRLRAEGLARFPLELGLVYERRVGDAVAVLGGDLSR